MKPETIIKHIKAEKTKFYVEMIKRKVELDNIRRKILGYKNQIPTEIYDDLMLEFTDYDRRNKK